MTDPLFAQQYPSGPAAMFAGVARRKRQCSCLDPIHPGDNEKCLVHGKISFPCQVECHIGNYGISLGDTLTIRPLGEGLLWAVSGSWWGDLDFAYLNADAINQLAGFELVKEEQ